MFQSIISGGARSLLWRGRPGGLVHQHTCGHQSKNYRLVHSGHPFSAASSSASSSSSQEADEDDDAFPRVDDTMFGDDDEDEPVLRLDELGRAYATGRRKTSVARVWLKQGDGRFTINGRELHEYFGRIAYREKLVEPFVVTGTAGFYDVWCTVKGGGTTGQVGAISLGISRALEVWNPEFRPPLAAESLFTRDSRAVERKKPGQPKARKKDQWVKR